VNDRKDGRGLNEFFLSVVQISGMIERPVRQKSLPGLCGDSFGGHQ
jgi:hypothetical protein